LSSTFRDMDAERTHLIKQVFPKVRAACQARQVGFTEIDLRWGVSEEEAKNGATVEICLKEIDRCRDFPPFFIGFLGERYGWIPRHEELQSYWGKQADTKYEHQILEAVKQRISVTELEMQLAVLQHGAADKLHGHALFLLRDAQLTDTLYTEQTGKAPDHQDTAFYDAGQGKLAALKDRIRQSSYLGVDSYTSVEQFGEAIEHYLLAQLDKHFPSDQIPSAFEKSNAAHAAFRYHRLTTFLPREDVRESVIDAINKRTELPALGSILVAGPSGQGKSAFMADLASYIESHHPEYKVIDHYIGADDRNSLDSWLYRILQALHPIIKDISGEIPESHRDRIKALNTWLAMAATRQKVRYVLILDALDQLSDGGKDLSLLKQEIIGGNATVITSAADDTPAREAAKEIETILLPPLPTDLKAKLIQATLDKYRKKLPEDLASKLANSPQAGSPLYLTLAIEELRLDARHETLVPMMSDILKQPDAQSLFLQHFLLDEDNGRPELRTLAAVFMALLGASRAGLSEIELADLLAQPDDPIAEDTGKPRMPQIYLSKLLNNFAPFLLNKGGNRAPMHRIFGEAALLHEGKEIVRQHLYDHFSPGYGHSFDDTSFDARHAAEALYQVLHLSGSAPTMLKTDLARLYIPVRLLEVGEGNLLFNALSSFSFEEKIALGENWAKQIDFPDETALEAYGWGLGSFVNWLRDRVGHAIAAKLIQEPLLEARCRIFGGMHADTLIAMNDLAVILFDLGDIIGSREKYEQVLYARRHILGNSHQDTFAAMSNLAITLQAQGDLVGARTMQEQVLADYRRTLGEEHPDTLLAMNNLAMNLFAQGERVGARALFEKVLTFYRNAFSDEHRHSLLAKGNLAVSYRYLGDYAGAIALDKQVLSDRQRILGMEHPDTLSAMSSLASTLYEQDNLSEAMEIQKQVLKASLRVLGEEHSDTLTARNNLALTLHRLGKLTEAQEQFKLTVSAYKKHLGVDHPDTLAVMGNQSLNLAAQGSFADAREIREKVLASSLSILGEEHPDTLISMDNLAAILYSQGDLTGARDMQRQVMVSAQRILGNSHPTTLKVMENLSVTFKALGESSAAFNLRLQVAKLRSATK